MADEVASAAPLDECEYSVVLGESLLESADEQQQQSDVFASFGYEFQPASVDKSTPGLVSVDGSSGVQVLMGSSSGVPGGVGFKGKLVEHKETDCLLIFDGTRFRLERCPFSCMQLRHVRAPTPRRRMEIQKLKQANGSDATNTSKVAPASTTIGAAKRPVGRLKGSANKRSAVKAKACTGVKRPVGRPKGSTKAAIAAKKAGLEGASNTISET